MVYGLLSKARSVWVCLRSQMMRHFVVVTIRAWVNLRFVQSIIDEVVEELVVTLMDPVAMSITLLFLMVENGARILDWQLLSLLLLDLSRFLYECA